MYGIISEHLNAISLFLIHILELIFHENITNGIPNELELIIMDLMSINNVNEDMPDFRISPIFQTLLIQIPKLIMSYLQI